MKNSCFLFIFFSVISFAQDNQRQFKIDSTLSVLAKMKEDTAKVNLINKITYRRDPIFFEPDTRKKLILQSLSIAKKNNYKEGEGSAYVSLGNYYATNYDKNNALANYSKASNIFTSLKMDAKIAQSYINIGNVYADFNDYSAALTYYFKAVKINERIKNYKNMVGNYGNIATIYNGLDDTKKTIHYGNLSIKYAKLVNNERALAVIYLMFVQLYTKINNIKLAEFYVEKGYEMSVKIGDLNNIAVSLIGMGVIEKKKKNYLEAVDKLSQALQRFSEVGNSLGMATAHSEIGLSYAMLYEIDKKKEFLEKSKYNLTQSNKLYLENELIDGLPENYLQLSKINEIEKNPVEGLVNYKLYTKFKDSIFNADKKETIKSLEDKREIELRDKKLKINRLEIQNKERQKWYLIGGILSLCIIGGLLFYQSRNRKKTNEKLQLLNNDLDEANKTKTRFFSILNHDLRSPVSNLIHFFHLQKDSPELLDAESKKRLENKTISGAENLLASMEDILLWSKGQMENFKPQPKSILINSLFEDTRKHFESEEKVMITFENAKEISLLTDENYLKTIMRNLTGNAIKALEKVEKPIITWKAWKDQDQTFLSISDNGFGGTQDQFKALYDEKEVVGIKTGLGLHLIRDLAKAIDCFITVDSQKTKGTTFTLHFNPQKKT